jgi:SulP family sulfate permease
VFTVDGPFFFGAVENFDRALSGSQTYPKYLIIRLKWVPFIDMTGIQSLENVIGNLHQQGVTVMLSGANHSVSNKLKRGGITQLVGEHNMFKSFDDALRTAQSELKQIEDK